MIEHKVIFEWKTNQMLQLEGFGHNHEKCKQKDETWGQSLKNNVPPLQQEEFSEGNFIPKQNDNVPSPNMDGGKGSAPQLILLSD